MIRTASALGAQDTVPIAVDSLSATGASAGASAPQVDASSAVPERGGPPDTVSAMKTGYIMASVIFLAYIVLLMRRVASVRKSS